MAETKAPKRLSKVAKEFNVATTTIREYLEKQGIEISNNPNAKITSDAYEVLLQKFQPDKLDKEKTEQIILPGSAKKKKDEQETATESTGDDSKQEAKVTEETKEEAPKESDKEPVQSIEDSEQETAEDKKDEEAAATESTEDESKEEVQTESTDTEIKGPKVIGKIDLQELSQESTSKKTAKSKAKSSIKSKKGGEEPSTQKAEETTEKEESQVEEEGSVEQANKSQETPTETQQEAATSEKDQQVSVESTEEKEPPEAAKEEIQVEKEPPEADQETSEQESDESSKEEKTEKEGDDYKMEGLTVVGKINLDDVKSNKPKKKPVASTSDMSTIKKKRRKRKKISEEKPEKDNTEKKKTTKEGDKSSTEKKDKKQEQLKKRKKKTKKQGEDVDEQQVQDQIKETLSKLSEKQKGGTRSKFRKKKRDEVKQKEEELQQQQEEKEKHTIQVTEFITINELANIMDVAVTDLIATCMNLGLMVSINQRVDAETITILADEYGYDVEFTEAEMDEPSLEEPDNPDCYINKPPVVSIMGHVDHGKTSLLDYIRGSKIIAGESGGITQHIGAYEVTLDDGRNMTFLDTPGHEAFTAMRARGAKATDVAVIIIAADDQIMPQTKEAISHAQAAEVPIVFAINKVDKENADPQKVKQELAEMNILVEEWGGKYQCQEISAKKGEHVDDLLEKILLESELLELKADPNKRAVGSVVEAWLDKGKGIVVNLLVEGGTLRVGDPVLAGSNWARVRAMLDERSRKVEKAVPGQPVQVLGFDGAPQAGEKFYVTEEENTAKEIATERKQLIREQGIRATKHITLDELGRRLAIGNFQELKVVIKGDVDGSVEAIADSLQKLSTEEVQVKVIHKGVGQITESDVLLASASDAIIIGFQVRPSANARKLAEQEQIDLRLYSVIYDAIQEVKSAMEGMLAPNVEEKVTGNLEVRETFNVKKVGTIAGCKVMDGKVIRNGKVRVVRDGVVIHSGEIENLKRYKEDVKEVTSGYECGLKLKNFNELQEGDHIEAYEEFEVKRKL